MLRSITEADLPILFEHQRDPESNARSVRVLERCGFRRIGRPERNPDGVVELHYRLEA